MEKEHNEIALFSKTKLNSIEILNFKDLIDSYIGHDEFVSVDVLEE